MFQRGFDTAFKKIYKRSVPGYSLLVRSFIPFGTLLFKADVGASALSIIYLLFLFQTFELLFHILHPIQYAIAQK